MRTDTQTKKSVAYPVAKLHTQNTSHSEVSKWWTHAVSVIVKLHTLNGRVSEEWMLFIHGATPAMAQELADTVLPIELSPKLCEAVGVQSGEQCNIHYMVTPVSLSEEMIATYGDGPNVIRTEVEVVQV